MSSPRAKRCRERRHFKSYIMLYDKHDMYYITAYVILDVMIYYITVLRHFLLGMHGAELVLDLVELLVVLLAARLYSNA